MQAENQFSSLSRVTSRQSRANMATSNSNLYNRGPAKQKAETGRTQPLNHASIGLPNNKRWQTLQNICSQERLTAKKGISLTNDKLQGAPGEFETTFSQSPRELSPREAMQQLHQELLFPIFGVSSPIVSGTTFATYSAAKGQEVQARDFGKSLLERTLAKKNANNIHQSRSGTLTSRQQIDLSKAVIKIRSPNQVLAFIKTGQMLNSSSPKKSKDDQDSPIKDGRHSKNHRCGQSSQLSKDDSAPGGDSILKPVIENYNSSQKGGNNDDLEQSDLSPDKLMEDGRDSPIKVQQLTTIQTVESAMNLQNQHLQTSSSRFNTKMLSSDKNTVFMDGTVLSRRLLLLNKSGTEIEDTSLIDKTSINRSSAKSPFSAKRVQSQTKTLKMLGQLQQEKMQVNPKKFTTLLNVLPRNASSIPQADLLQHADISPTLRQNKSHIREGMQLKQPTLVSMTLDINQARQTQAAMNSQSKLASSGNMPSKVSLRVQEMYMRSSQNKPSSANKLNPSIQSPPKNLNFQEVKSRPIINIPEVTMLQDHFQPILQQDLAGSPLLRQKTAESPGRKRVESLNGPLLNISGKKPSEATMGQDAGGKKQFNDSMLRIEPINISNLRLESQGGCDSRNNTQSKTGQDIRNVHSVPTDYSKGHQDKNSSSASVIQIVPRQPTVTMQSKVSSYNTKPNLESAIQGMKALNSSQVSQRKFKQLKQRQIKLETPQLMKYNNKAVFNQTYTRQQARAGQLVRNNLNKNLAKAVERQAQTSRNDMGTQAGRSTSPLSGPDKHQTHTALGFADAINGIINQQRDIGTLSQLQNIEKTISNAHVVVKDSQQKETSTTGEVLPSTLEAPSSYRATHNDVNFKIGGQRQQLHLTLSPRNYQSLNHQRKREQYVAANQQRQAMTAGHRSRRQQVFKDLRINSLASGQKSATIAVTSIKTKPGTGYKTCRAKNYNLISSGEKDLASTKSFNSTTKRVNSTLSQVLGIRQQKACSPRETNQQNYNTFEASTQLPSQQQNQSELMNQSLSYGRNQVSHSNQQHQTMTISKAQAKELNNMRSRIIRSQGGPRHRYLNQRQQLYNLMAKDLKRQTIPTEVQSINSLADAVSKPLSQGVQSVNSVQQLQEKAINLEVTSINSSADQQPLFDSQQLGDQQQSLLSSQQNVKIVVDGKDENQQLSSPINCENQLDSIAAVGQVASIMTGPTPTPRAQIVKPDFTISSRSVKQRMDLPFKMSAQQAHFIMGQTSRAQMMEQKELYHRQHKKRENASRVCMTARPSIQIQQGNQEDFEDSVLAKEQKTKLEYCGVIHTEPKFTLSCKQKSPADYARQSQSMTLNLPVEKQEFLMQLQEDPRVPYSRARTKQINASLLQNTDETFAMIQSHLESLQGRTKLDLRKIIYQKIIESEASRQNSSPINIGQLVQDEASFQTLYSPEATTETVMDKVPFVTNIEVNKKPLRKQIQILRMNDASVDQHQMNSQQFTTGFSQDQLDMIRLSTKLMPVENISSRQKKSRRSIKEQNAAAGISNNNDQTTTERMTTLENQGQLMQIINQQTSNQQTTNTQMQNQISQAADFNNLQQMKRQPISPQPMIDTQAKLLEMTKKQIEQPSEEHQQQAVRQSDAVKMMTMTRPDNVADRDDANSYRKIITNDHMSQQYSIDSQYVLTNLFIKSGTHIKLLDSSSKQIQNNPNSMILDTDTSNQQQPPQQQNLQQSTVQILQRNSSGSAQINDSLDIEKLGPITKLSAKLNHHTNVIGGTRTSNAFSSKKQSMRNHQGSQVMRENKLKKRSERDKAIKISGIKMFNRELSNQSQSHVQSKKEVTPFATVAGGGDNVTKIQVPRQPVAVEHKQFINTGLPTLEMNSGVQTPNQQQQEARDNQFEVVNQDGYIEDQMSPQKIDSYDGISTQKKSPSLVDKKSHFFGNNQSPKHPNLLGLKKPRHSDPQPISPKKSEANEEIQANETMQTFDIGLEQRQMALTPLVIQSARVSRQKEKITVLDSPVVYMTEDELGGDSPVKEILCQNSSSEIILQPTEMQHISDNQGKK